MIEWSEENDKIKIKQVLLTDKQSEKINTETRNIMSQEYLNCAPQIRLTEGFTCSCRTAVQAVRGYDRGGGVAAEVHYRACCCGWHRSHDGRLAWWDVLCLVLVPLMMRGTGRDTVFRQELFQIHVLQLESVSIIGEGFVPQSWSKESWLGGAALFLQVLFLLLFFAKCCQRRWKKMQQSVQF